MPNACKYVIYEKKRTGIYSVRVQRVATCTAQASQRYMATPAQLTCHCLI